MLGHGLRYTCARGKMYVNGRGGKMDIDCVLGRDE